MRNNEQFKAYVYEKADAVRAKNKRMHAAWVRGAVAFSLLVVVGSVYLFSNSDAKNTVMEPTSECVANKSMGLAVAEQEIATFDYAALADAVSVVEDSESVSVTVTAVCEALPETMAAGTYAQYMYSAVITDFTSEKEEYTVAENAAEYTGDLTDIDFSKNVALVFTARTDIASWKIEYGEDTIAVTLTAGNERKRNVAYTILLEKEKYTGQEIELCYK